MGLKDYTWDKTFFASDSPVFVRNDQDAGDFRNFSNIDRISDRGDIGWNKKGRAFPESGGPSMSRSCSECHKILSVYYFNDFYYSFYKTDCRNIYRR